MTASTFTNVLVIGFVGFAVFVVISAAVGGFLSVTKGEPPPYEPEHVQPSNEPLDPTAIGKAIEQARRMWGDG